MQVEAETTLKTYSQARAEVRRRWGRYPFVAIRLGVHLVGVMVPSKWGGRTEAVYGSGPSWDEAFADADRKTAR